MSTADTAHDRIRRTARAAALCLVAVIVAFICLVPQGSAFALEVRSCTAKPNAETGSQVLGGKETRITWEASVPSGESVASFKLTLPPDTTYTLQDDANDPSAYRLTVLTGSDFMTRNDPPANIAADDADVTVVFDEPLAYDGDYRIRLEIYGVFFPSEGGEMPIAASYALADGTEVDLPENSVIAVEGMPLIRQITTWLEQQQWVQSWNSVTFLRLFLNPIIIVSSFPVVLKGFAMALAVVAVAFPLAIPIGLLLALMRMARLRVLRGLGGLYVNVVRGTPMFLQLYIAFLGLPLAGINIPDYLLAVLVLAFNSAAYMCEIFRAGIQSIPKGQFEASRSLGMSGAQTMLFVIIPQTVRRVLPTMTNEFILLYKDTSLLAGVGFMEIVMYARSIVASTGSITPYIVAALFYLVITIPLARFVGKLETRLAGNDGGSAAAGSKKDRKARRRLEPAEPQDAPAETEGTSDGMAVSPERFSSM